MKQYEDQFLIEFFRDCRENPLSFLSKLEADPGLANVFHPNMQYLHILAEPAQGMIGGGFSESDLVQILLDHGADPRLAIVQSIPMFHWAVSWGKYPFEFMQRIMDYGIDVNLSCKGITPLHSACEAGNLDGIIFLLLNGANPNLATKNGGTSLHTLVMSNPANHGLNVLQDAVKMLVEYGADQGALMHYQHGLYSPADMMRRWISYNFRRPNEYNTHSFTATFE